jgi:hypothetical protein
MGGQVHPPQADSIESRLHAKAMCVREEGVGLVIISCDLVSIPTAMAHSGEEVCRACHEPLKTRAEGEWWADMEEVFHCD